MTQHRSFTGAGYNLLCAHNEPEWHKDMNPGNQDGAWLFGAEYQDAGSMNKNKWHDAACVVCQLKSASVLPYVQWGRRTCANDHKLVYTGLVMGDSHLDKAKHEFVCVDMERAAHKTNNPAHEGGLHLYSTEFENSALWPGLDKYGSNKEIACAVCA